MENNIYNNLGEKELKYSYWFVTHRVFLRKLGIVLLGAVVLSLLVYGIILITNYYIRSSQDTQNLAASLAQEKLNLELLAESNKPKALDIGETMVLRGGTGTVDFLVEVSNPNLQWAVSSLDYYFLIGEEKTPVKTAFVLPGQSKYLLNFNYLSASTNVVARVVLENIKWEKVVDFEALQTKTLDFEIKNTKIEPIIKPTNTDPESVTKISFDIFNKSAYSFWEPRFVVLLERGGQIVGVAETQINSLGSSERKTETLNLFQSIPAATQIRIMPDINILDPNVFKGFDAGPGEKK